MHNFRPTQSHSELSANSDFVPPGAHYICPRNNDKTVADNNIVDGDWLIASTDAYPILLVGVSRRSRVVWAA